jgi:hypothetical protein
VKQPDRWHELQAAIKASDLPPADRHVFLDRLGHSTYGTAEMTAEYTRTQKKVARETGLSLRQVRYSEAHLERHGWLKVTGTTAPGKTREYEFAIGRECDCTGRVHAPEQRQRPRSEQPTAATPQVSTRMPPAGAGLESSVAAVRRQPTAATPKVNGQIRGRDFDEGKGFERQQETERPDWTLVWRLIRIVHADPCGGIHRDALAERLGLSPYSRELSHAIGIAYRKKKIDCCDRYIVKPPSVKEK